MKTTFLLLALAFSSSFFSNSLFAQYNARSLTRKVVPSNQQKKATPAPTPTPDTPPVPIPEPATPPVVRRPAPVAVVRPVDPEKEKAAQEKADQKAVEFEKQRAEQDYGWAQYALGVRYMTGKGVEKDPEQARKLLEKAAKNGESQATKKLAELDKEKNEATEAITTGDKPAKLGNAEKPAQAEKIDSQSKVEKK